ncbi:hypothetical protein QBC33DRAFT_194423 [Phialemonium atrogriseum]|uniref:Uncharacterized protein n=1 Tax=Phialemonium atrogriseum TaxID=1093897 RepID=A0AAJ0BUS5_9PEZI|nr:uncharacterized protein QBC33DRAFT_194423 [Phialemonium atrogriseum]KAK1764695.1 hypothetical protein QBC33DRAFT_194423 [Phialemonium atrogriseum]
MPLVKPTLALSTPVSANFPRDASRNGPYEIPSAVSVQTPLSARSMLRDPLPSAGLPSAGLASAGYAFSPTGPLSARVKTEEKTPITPPLAYLDFLRSMTLSSPPLSAKAPLNRTSTHGSTASNSSTSTINSAASEQEKGESVPSTAASEGTDYSCKCDHALKSPKVAPINTAEAGSSGTGLKHPLSAPAIGPTFPSLSIPPSPATRNKGGNVASPKTPWSSRSVRSPFDWEAALKARRHAEGSRPAASSPKISAPRMASTPTAGAPGGGSKREARTSVRHIREVMTRTIKYTPRVGPVPKGKRRKVDHETAIET